MCRALFCRSLCLDLTETCSVTILWMIMRKIISALCCLVYQLYAQSHAHIPTGEQCYLIRFSLGFISECDLRHVRHQRQFVFLFFLCCLCSLGCRGLVVGTSVVNCKDLSAICVDADVKPHLLISVEHL